nr:hypothetical protein [Terriglobales bacterium]
MRVKESHLTLFALAVFAASFCLTASAQNKTYTCDHLNFFNVPTSGRNIPAVTGLNDGDVVTGWYVDPVKIVDVGLIRRNGGHLLTYSVPGSQNTMMYGINNSQTLVGAYDTHGFVKAGTTLATLDYPGATYT